MAAALAAIGLPAGVTRYISFYKGKEDKGRIKGTIISAIKMNLPISIIFALLLFFGAGWISVHIFHDANLTPVLRVFSIAVPFLVLAQNFSTKFPICNSVNLRFHLLKAHCCR